MSPVNSPVTLIAEDLLLLLLDDHDLGERQLDQDGAAERDLELVGLGLPRLVVEQQEQEILCDQRHRADGTTRD